MKPRSIMSAETPMDGRQSPFWGCRATSASLARQGEAAVDPQLELALAGSNARRMPAAAQRRLSRANWWFERMRQIVDCACDWQPAPLARPEQIWFPNTHRHPALAAQPDSEECQICE
jgi:hypothetical protein